MAIDDSHIINSYRYLRLGLLVVTLTLGISLGLEIRETRCLQGSISAYYYTPVHAVLIGVLFATGFSLVALRGRDLVEDLFFNLAGFLAPAVALVPTSRPDDLGGPAGRLLTLPDGNRPLIANNTVALFLGSAVAVGVAAAVAALRRSRRDGASVREGARTEMSRVPKSVVVGLALSLAVLVAGAAWYGLARGTFERRAHGVAAVLMFVAIWFAVMVNADVAWFRPVHRWLYRALGATVPDPDPTSRHVTFYRPRYRWVALVMVVVAIVLGGSAAGGVGHAVFWLEVAEIVPFAAFWALQTGEGWDTGVTSPTMAAAAAGA